MKTLGTVGGSRAAGLGVVRDALRARFLESIAAGLADAEAGRVIDTAALRKLIRSRRAERSRA